LVVGLHGFWKGHRERKAALGLEQALEAYGAKNWRGAASGLGTYLSRYEGENHIWLKYAVAQHHLWRQSVQARRRVRSHRDQAILAYRRVLRKDPAHAEAAIVVSTLYLKSGSPEEAEMVLSQFLAVAPDNVEALMQRSLALEHLDRWGDAAADLRTVIAKTPTHVPAHVQLAFLVREREEVHGDPYGILRTAVERSPSSRDAHEAIRDHLEHWFPAGWDAKGGIQGEPDPGAEQAWKQDPANASLAVTVARIRMARGNFEEAWQVLKGLQPDERSVADARIDLLLLQGKTEAARIEAIDLADKAAEKAFGTDPQNALLAVYVAGLKKGRREFREAHAILDRLDQETEVVKRARIDLLMAEGKASIALALCDDLVNTRKDVTSHLLRATVRQALRQFDDAREDHEAVTQFEPENPEAWLSLSRFCSDRGETGDAVKAVERALAINGTRPSTVLFAVRLYERSRDPEVRSKGEELLERALEVNPQDVGLLAFRAQHLINRKSRAALDQAQEILEDITRRSPNYVSMWALLARARIFLNLPEAALDAVNGGLKALQDTADEPWRRRRPFRRAKAEQWRWPAKATATATLRRTLLLLKAEAENIR